MKKQKHQGGFTLIELMVVVVILGVLSAVALPRFINFGGDARRAVLDGLQGAAASAATMVYGKAAIEGRDLGAGPNDTTVDGVTVTLVHGYPNAATIDNFIRDRAGTTFATGTWTLRDNCTLTYVNAASANAGPTFTRVVSGC